MTIEQWSDCSTATSIIYVVMWRRLNLHVTANLNVYTMSLAYSHYVVCVCGLNFYITSRRLFRKNKIDCFVNLIHIIIYLVGSSWYLVHCIYACRLWFAQCTRRRMGSDCCNLYTAILAFRRILALFEPDFG